MKVALYEILNDDSRHPYLNEASNYMEENTRYIRVSNIMEVDFEMVDDALIIPKKVDYIRAEKVKSAAEYDEQIAKLLSITHQPEEELFIPEFGTPEEGAKPFLDVEAEIEGEEEGT